MYGVNDQGPLPSPSQPLTLGSDALTPSPGELVVKEHASKFGRTASSWPKAALASLRRRHEHLVFLVHQVWKTIVWMKGKEQTVY